MTKTKIIQQLKEMLRIAEQDEDDFFEEYKKKHPDMEWLCESGRSYSIKLGIIEAKIEFLLMFLEMDVKEEEKYGRQAVDM